MDHKLPGFLPAGLQGKRHRHRAVADREVLDPERGGLSSRGTLTFTSATRDEMVDRTESWDCEPINPSTSTQTTQTNTQTTPDDPSIPPGPGPTTNDDSSSSENNNDDGGLGGSGVQWIDPSGGTLTSSGFGLRYDRFRSERPKPRYLLPLLWTLDAQL
jgi:hypothetical protein